jgi:hypothetical protein
MDDEEEWQRIKNLARSKSRINILSSSKEEEDKDMAEPLMSAISTSPDQHVKKIKGKSKKVMIIDDDDDENILGKKEKESERIKQYYIAAITLNNNNSNQEIGYSHTPAISPRSSFYEHSLSSAQLALSWDSNATQIEDNVKKAKTNVNFIIYFSVFIASLSILQAGFNIGVTSGAIINVEEIFELSILEKGAVMGALNLSSIFGVFTVNAISDGKGRKVAIAISSLILATGLLVTVISEGFLSFLLGRSRFELG